MLREAPTGSRRPSGTRGTNSEPRAFGLEEPDRRDTGLRSRTCPTESEASAGAPSPEKEELRLLVRRAGPELRPRELRNPAGTRTSVHGLARRNRGFGSGSCRTRDQRLRPAEPPRREQGLRFQIRRTANRRGFGPVGEPPGKPDWALAPSGLRRMRGQGFGPGYRSSKPPGADARALGFGLTQRDSGGRQRCRPPLLFWALLFLGWARFRTPLLASVSPTRVGSAHSLNGVDDRLGLVRL